MHTLDTILEVKYLNSKYETLVQNNVCYSLQLQMNDLF